MPSVPVTVKLPVVASNVLKNTGEACAGEDHPGGTSASGAGEDEPCDDVERTDADLDPRTEWLVEPEEDGRQGGDARNGAKRPEERHPDDRPRVLHRNEDPRRDDARRQPIPIGVPVRHSIYQGSGVGEPASAATSMTAGEKDSSSS